MCQIVPRNLAWVQSVDWLGSATVFHCNAHGFDMDVKLRQLHAAIGPSALFCRYTILGLEIRTSHGSATCHIDTKQKLGGTLIDTSCLWVFTIQMNKESSVILATNYWISFLADMINTQVVCITFSESKSYQIRINSHMTKPRHS